MSLSEFPPNVAMVFIQGGDPEVSMVLGPTPASPTKLANARLLLEELARKPSEADISIFSNQWMKDTWFTTGDGRFCLWDMDQATVLRSYSRIQSVYRVQLAKFYSEIFPLIRDAFRKGGMIVDVWEDVVQIRAIHLIWTRVRAVSLDSQGLITAMGYALPAGGASLENQRSHDALIQLVQSSL
ncbi:hypothetical protein BKA70DRAFT_1221908 [Coprinopsis sp. MPI-PUGE-AT-0042]|nr:hypothetical protein BKA70DRAFT_1221908 [Coprinopsis sp. MPI-PUGE-AT-0042]